MKKILLVLGSGFLLMAITACTDGDDATVTKKNESKELPAKCQSSKCNSDRQYKMR